MSIGSKRLGWVVLAAVVVGILFIARSRMAKAPAEAETPSGAVYYSGPMKGKKGDLAPDSWAQQ